MLNVCLYRIKWPDGDGTVLVYGIVGRNGSKSLWQLRETIDARNEDQLYNWLMLKKLRRSRANNMRTVNNLA